MSIVFVASSLCRRYHPSSEQHAPACAARIQHAQQRRQPIKENEEVPVMPTCDEIKAALAAQRERVETWFHALSADDMLRPVTASEVADAEMWTPKDHLAHVLTGERYFQGVIKRALGGAEDALGFFTQTGTDDRAAHRNVINQANERTANKYRAEPVEALFARIGETRQATLALLESVDDDQLAQSVAHSPFGDGTLGALFMMIAQHGEQHIKWLDIALAERDVQSR